MIYLSKYKGSELVSKKVFVKKVYAYQFDSIEINFRYKNSQVYTTEKFTTVAYSNGTFKAREIEMVSMCYVEDYDSATEGVRYCRSEILIIQDIISFFTGIPFTVYNEISSSCSIEEICWQEKPTNLVIEGESYTDQLNKLLQKIYTEQELIGSLLDRWRKANYLKDESCDANLYHDEAILSYFHIIKLFAENNSHEIKNKLDVEMNSLLSDYYNRNFFFSANQINSKIGSIKEVLYEILIGKELTLSYKIKYFLESYNLLDPNVNYFIDSMIKIRNAIAHGRITYQEKHIWPIPPFFCLARDSYDVLELLQLLTGRMISCYIDISCWVKEWEEAKMFLLPSEENFNSFLKGNCQFVDITKESLCTGNSQNITWATIFNHYVKNPRKFSVERIAVSFKEFFLNTEITEENGADLFNVSVILCDHDDDSIREKAISNIKKIIKEQWFSWSNFKDLYRYLDYNNVAPTWYKEYLENGLYRDI